MMDNETAWQVRRIVLSVLFVVVVAVPLYPELFGLDEVTPFPQLVAFRPQALVLGLVVAVLMLLREGWRISAGLLALLVLTGAGLAAPRALTDPQPPAAGSRALTIMVANVLGGGADAGEVAKLIRSRRPDLVSLPEARVDVRQEIEAHLQGLGYRGFTQQANAAVESATSVLVAGTLGDVRFDAETVAAARTTLGESGTERQTTQQTSTRFGHVVVTGGTLGRLRIIAYHGFPPLPDAVPTWKDDLLVLRRWCRQDQPTVVAGDFNATTDHADFRAALGRDCRSVAPAVGAGLQGTWPANRPAVARTQIDHVVVRAPVVPSTFRTYRLEGSDHRAVVATVAVPKG